MAQKTVLYALCWFVLASCTTLPKAIDFKQNYYEDDSVKVEYAIGTKVHYIVVHNKTTKEMFVQSNRASIISFTGETSSLMLASSDDHIPPNSRQVFISKASTFFDTDIWKYFKYFPVTTMSSSINEKEYILRMKGEMIRLFFPIIIDSIETIYEIPLEIIGVKEFK